MKRFENVRILAELEKEYYFDEGKLDLLNYSLPCEAYQAAFVSSENGTLANVYFEKKKFAYGSRIFD